MCHVQVYSKHLRELPMGLARLLILELLLFFPNHLERLRDNVLRRVGPPSVQSSAEFASIDKQMINDEEVLWDHVPYGPSWDYCALSSLTIEIVSLYDTSYTPYIHV